MFAWKVNIVDQIGFWVIRNGGWHLCRRDSKIEIECRNPRLKNASTQKQLYYISTRYRFANHTDLTTNNGSIYEIDVGHLLNKQRSTSKI